MEDLYQYVNGEWFKGSDAKISIYDLVVTRGLGVFETLRTYNGKPNKLDQHIARLKNSCQEIGIEVPAVIDEMAKIITEGCAKNGGGDFTLRITITGGINHGMLASPHPGVLVGFLPLKVPRKEQYETGLKLITHKEMRTLPHTKNTNYIVAKRGLMQAQNNDADDALYVDEEGNVYETTIANIFFVKDGTLITPKDNVLPGITRKAVIDLARAAGMNVEERSVNMNEVKTMEEVFLTGSIKEVMAVRAIDDYEFRPNGPVTKQLAQGYREEVNR